MIKDFSHLPVIYPINNLTDEDVTLRLSTTTTILKAHTKTNIKIENSSDFALVNQRVTESGIDSVENGKRLFAADLTKSHYDYAQGFFTKLNLNRRIKVPKQVNPDGSYSTFGGNVNFYTRGKTYSFSFTSVTVKNGSHGDLEDCTVLVMCNGFDEVPQGRAPAVYKLVEEHESYFDAELVSKFPSTLKFKSPTYQIIASGNTASIPFELGTLE